MILIVDGVIVDIIKDLRDALLGDYSDHYTIVKRFKDMVEKSGVKTTDSDLYIVSLYLADLLSEINIGKDMRVVKTDPI